MLPFLLKRPIAVFMSFLAILIFSGLALYQLPVSLLPNLEVPKILIRVSYPNASPAEIEQNVLENIRAQLITLDNIKNIESEATSELGLVYLDFEFGTNMDLAYIEVNEKIDRLQGSLPKNIERPTVVKSNSTDIPIVKLHIQNKSQAQQPLDLVELSAFAEKAIKKRLETLDGVSVVDLNGLQRPQISITPNASKLRALGISNQQLWLAIQSQNTDLGAVSVRDGHYRYFLRLENELTSAKDIEAVSLQLPTRSVSIGEVATVKMEKEKPTSYHLIKGQVGLVINIHKQRQAQMQSLILLVEDAVEQFRKDFPQLEFQFSQNQSELLNASISNLSGSLLLGGFFAFIVLFLFMGNFRLPLIIGISLPSSLLISFLLFEWLGLSINIISLGGLALGLGMLIDNSIIVLDNISTVWKRKEESQNTTAASLFEACVEGTSQVIAPLISSVLTTLAVFVPLVFLSGLAGAFFYEQALAIASILGASLLVAFVLLPLCYLLFFKSIQLNPNQQQETFLFSFFLALYRKAHHAIFNFPKLSFTFLLAISPLGWLIYQNLSVQSLPDIEQRDFNIFIAWNEAIDLEENKARSKQVLEFWESTAQFSESDIGFKQFLVESDNSNLLTSHFYFKLNQGTDKLTEIQRFREWFAQRFPKSELGISEAKTAFTQLFQNQRPTLELLMSHAQSKELLNMAEVKDMMEQFSMFDGQLGKGLSTERVVLLKLQPEKIQAYKLSYIQVLNKLKSLFGQTLVSEIKTFGEVIPIKGKVQEADFRYLLNTQFVQYGNHKALLKDLVEVSYQEDYRSIFADQSSVFQSLFFTNPAYADVLREKVAKVDKLHPKIDLALTGNYFENQAMIRQMQYILLLSVILLYFILSAQFESFWQPIIVLLTLPLAISGSLLFLWASGQSLNLISAIGMVVMLGVIVNDAILKIDTINRLLRKEGRPLKQAIMVAGEIRLKPILMTSITTILALLPVLFSSGLGADLQRPLAIAVIGGLSIGTLTAIFFIPLSFWLFHKRDIAL